MTHIDIKVAGAAIVSTRKEGLLTAGMVGATATFAFDASWGGLSKIAVFRCGGVTKDQVMSGSTADIPWEVLRRGGILYVGVEGRNGDGSLVIPTVWARAGTVHDGANASGDPSTDPGPPVWAQILAVIGELVDLKTADKSSIVAAVNEVLSKSGGAVDEAEVQRMVEEYLAQHPLEVTESDPTVPEWAKQKTKPSYTADEVGALPDTYTPPAAPVQSVNGKTGAVNLTAEDVGALPDDTQIPTVPDWVKSIAAEVGQYFRVSAVDENGNVSAVEAVDMASGGGEIDLSREPDLVLEVSEAVTSLSISDIDGEPIDTTEMVVLWEHPGGAQYVPNYFRFNNAIKNSTITDSIIANFNLHVELCPSANYGAAILTRVKKINNGTYWQEYSGLQQNAGTITGVINKVMGGPYRNILIGETSIKEFFVYQSSNIQEGCKVSVWVK